MAAKHNGHYNTVWKIYLFLIIMLLPQTMLSEDKSKEENDNLNFLNYLQEIENKAGILKRKLSNIRDEADELILRLDRLILIKIDNMKENGQFVPPRITKNEKLINLENKMADLQKNVTELINEFQQNNDDIVKIMPKLNILEEELELLHKQLDNEKRNTRQDIGKYDDTLQNLTTKYNKVTEQVKNLFKDFQERESIKLLQNLIEECVKAIRNANYDTATEKLKLITDDNKIFEIVKEVYKHEIIKNFDLIIKFSSTIKNISRKFLVVKALFNEMTEHSEQNGNKILQLIESIKGEIIQPTAASQTTKSEAADLVKVLKTKLKKSGTDYLKTKLIKGDLKRHTDELTDRIYLLDNNLYKDMFVEFIKDVYKSRLNAVKDLLILTNNRPYTAQLAIGFTNIFYEMLNNNDLNNLEIINLAHYVKELQDMNDYNKLSNNIKQDLENLIYSLPRSVKNLIFSKQICIKNIGRSEYFYAASGANNYFLYDNERRNVFTWVGGEHVQQGGWSVKRIQDNKYYLHNNVHKEYMYAAGFGRDPERRFVFTWVPGGYDEQSEWEIEPDGDNCYIKSTYYNEYLYAANYKFDIVFNWQRRRVFTWIPEGKNMADKHWLWYIEECNYFEGI